MLGHVVKPFFFALLCFWCHLEDELYNICCISLWNFNKTPSIETEFRALRCFTSLWIVLLWVCEFRLLSLSLYVRACLVLFFLSFEWHKFSISIQVFSKKKRILLDFPIVWLSLRVTVYHCYNWKTVSAVSVFTKGKRQKRLWTVRWFCAVKSGPLGFHHITQQMSHTYSKTRLQESYTGIKSGAWNIHNSAVHRLL